MQIWFSTSEVRRMSDLASDWPNCFIYSLIKLGSLELLLTTESGQGIAAFTRLSEAKTQHRPNCSAMSTVHVVVALTFRQYSR